MPLIQQKQIQPNLEFFRSGQLPGIEGVVLTFAHNWVGFNPAINWYAVQVWAICLIEQDGWLVGDRILLSQGVTISVDANNIYVVSKYKDINIARKEADLKDVSLKPERWEFYVTAAREIG